MQSKDVDRVARGLPITPWEHTAEHPIYGELTFKGPKHGLPRAGELAAHSALMDEMMADAGLTSDARAGTMLQFAAIAGVKVLMQPVEVARHEAKPVDGDDPGHVKIELEYYEPNDEQDPHWLVDVWTEFSAWRVEQLAGLRSLKKGLPVETSPGSGSSASSPSATESSPPTLA